MSISSALVDDFKLWQWDIKGPDFETFCSGSRMLPRDWPMPFQKEVPRKNCMTGHLGGWWTDVSGSALTCGDLVLCRSMSILRHYRQVWLSCLSDKRISWVVNVDSHRKYRDTMLPATVAGLPVHLWSDKSTTRRDSPEEEVLKDHLLDPHQFHEDLTIEGILEMFPRAFELRIMLSGCCELLYSSAINAMLGTLLYQTASKKLLSRFTGVRHTTLRIRHERHSIHNARSGGPKRRKLSYGTDWRNASLRQKAQPGTMSELSNWFLIGLPAQDSSSASRMTCIALPRRLVSNNNDSLDAANKIWQTGKSQQERRLGCIEAEVTSPCIAFPSRTVLNKQQDHDTVALRVAILFKQQVALPSEFPEPESLLKDSICFVAQVLVSENMQQSRMGQSEAHSTSVKSIIPREPNLDTSRSPEDTDKTVVEGVQYIRSNDASGVQFARHLLWRQMYTGHEVMDDVALCFPNSSTKTSAPVVFCSFAVLFSKGRWRSDRGQQLEGDFCYVTDASWYLHCGALLPAHLQSVFGDWSSAT